MNFDIQRQNVFIVKCQNHSEKETTSVKLKFNPFLPRQKWLNHSLPDRTLKNRVALFMTK